MIKYIVKRLGQTVIILVLLSMFVFLLLQMIPGDPVYAAVGDVILTEEEYADIYQKLNLDKPVTMRYLMWASDFLHGNLGYSYQYSRTVNELLGDRLPITLFLSSISLAITMGIGILLGVLCAVFHGKWVDSLFTLLANLGTCLPSFWVGVVLMYLFSVRMQALPSYGFSFPWENAKGWSQMVMPLICMSLGGICGLCRQTRSSMLGVIRQDYMRTARSKGLGGMAVILTHGLKNGLIPILTLIGGMVPRLIGGSTFVEQVFNIPGMGSLLVKGVTSRDVFIVQACVMLTGMITCLSMLLVDVLYAYVDPRIRLE